MDEKSTNYTALKSIAVGEEMALFGVADVTPIRDDFDIHPPEIFQKLDYGVSIGIKIADPVLQGIDDYPTLLYKFHYRIANQRLDIIAFKIANYIECKGYKALPIPASQIVVWKPEMRGHLSHKKVGYYAGHGWIGRNNLLIHPDFGSRIRYATILTDMPLNVDKPIEEDCGDCYACVSSCPANAIHTSKDDFDLDACYEKLDDFRRHSNGGRLGIHICGVCVKMCNGKR